MNGWPLLRQRLLNYDWVELWDEHGDNHTQTKTDLRLVHPFVVNVEQIMASVECRKNGYIGQSHRWCDLCHSKLTDIGAYQNLQCTYCKRRFSKRETHGSACTYITNVLDICNMCVCGGRDPHEHESDDLDDDVPMAYTGMSYFGMVQNEILEGLAKYFEDKARAEHESYSLVFEAVIRSNTVNACKRLICGLLPEDPTDFGVDEVSDVSSDTSEVEIVIEKQPVYAGGLYQNFEDKLQKQRYLDVVKSAMPIFELLGKSRIGPVKLLGVSPQVAHWFRQHMVAKLTHNGIPAAELQRCSRAGLCYMKAIKGKDKARWMRNKYPLGVTVRDLLVEFVKGRIEFRPGFKFLRVHNRVHVVRTSKKVTLVQCFALIYKENAYSLVAGDLDDEDVWAGFDYDLECVVPNRYASETPVFEVRDVRLGGSGDCWKKLPDCYVSYLEQFEGENSRMTISDMRRYFEEEAFSFGFNDAGQYGKWPVPKEESSQWQLYQNLFIKVTRQEDGDWHLEEVIGLLSTAYPQDHENGLYTLTTWLYSVEDRVVGLQSTIDKAMAAFVVPDNRRGNEALYAGPLAETVIAGHAEAPYAIPEGNQDLALKYGVQFSQYSGKWHPHPIHACLRIWECKHVIPKYVNTDAVFISMSQSNFDMCLQAKKNELHQWRVVNPIIDLKDFGRYTGTMTVPKETFTLPQFSEPTAVFHGSGQFMSPEQLLAISERNPTLRVIVITHIVPLEMYLTEHSFRAGYEDWVIDRESGTVTMTLEGDEGGKYEQPYYNALLFAKTISDSSGKNVWYGGVVESRSSHHIQVWTKYQLVVPSKLALHLDGYTLLPEVFTNTVLDRPLVPSALYNAMYAYGKVLMGVSEKDMWGKLRSFIVDKRYTMPLAVQQWLVATIMEVLKWSIVPKLQSQAYTSLLGEIYHHTAGWFWTKKQSRFECRYAKRMIKLMEPKQRLYTFPLQDLVVKTSSIRGCGYGLKVKYTKSMSDDPVLRRMYETAYGLWFGDKYRAKIISPSDDYLDLDNYTVSNYRCYNLFNQSGIPVEAAREFIDLMERRGGELLIDENAEKRMQLGVFRRENAKTLEQHRADDVEDRKLTEVLEEGGAPTVEEVVKEHMSISHMDAEEKIATDLLGPKPKVVPEAKLPPNGKLRGLEPLDVVEELEFLQGLLDVVDPKGKRVEKYPDIKPCLRKPHEALDPCSVPLPPSPVIPVQVIEPVVPVTDEPVEEIFTAGTSKKEVKFAEVLETPVHAKEVDEKTIVAAMKQKRAQWLEEVKQMKNAIPVEGGSRAQILYAKSVEDWEKLMKSRPRSVGTYHSYQGEALWDVLYPKTVNKRVRPIPYRSVKFYPPLKYPKNDCLLVAVHEATGITPAAVLFSAFKAMPVNDCEGADLSVNLLDPIGCHYNIQFVVKDGYSNTISRHGVKDVEVILIELHEGHFRALTRYAQMVPKPLSGIMAASIAKNVLELVDQFNQLPIINFKNWRPEPARAEAYIRALRANTTGLLGATPIGEEVLRSWEENIRQREKMGPMRYLAVVEGSPGCRKSSAIQRILRKPHWRNVRNFTVILPTARLKEDWVPKICAKEKNSLGLTLKQNNICTFEKVLTTDSPKQLVVQDEDKFPKGYKATLAIINPSVRFFIHLGDRYQSQRHEPNKDCLLNGPEMLGEGDFYSQYTSKYLLGTWRFGPNIANLFLLPSFSKDKGGIHFTDDPPSSPQELKRFLPWMSDEDLETSYLHMGRYVPSHAAKVWQEELTGSTTDTYSGSQGESVDVALVTLDNGAVQLTDYRIGFTVMTRAKNVIIVCKFDKHGPVAAAASLNNFWGPILRYRANYQQGKPVVIHRENCVDIMNRIGDLPQSVKIVLAGPPDKLSNRGFVEERWKSRVDFDNDYLDPDEVTPRGGGKLRYDGLYSEAYDFKVHIQEQPEPVAREEGVREVQVREVACRTHTCRANEAEKIEFHNAQVVDRVFRELSYKGEYSNQLPDTYLWRKDAPEIVAKFFRRSSKKQEAHKYFKGKMKLKERSKFYRYWDAHPGEDPRRFLPRAVSWGLSQSSKDNVSFALGVIQRINFSTKEANWSEYRAEAEFGDALWHALKHYANWHTPVPWSQFDYDVAVQKFQDRRASRSEAMQKLSLPRSDPDFTGMLTAKTQWKLKDVVKKPAKALQTIFVTADKYIFKMGPLGIYLLDKIMEHAPKHWYIHAKKTMTDFELWAKTLDDDCSWVINDLVGQDQGMSGGYVRMFTNLMEHFNVPSDLIEFYVDSKLDFKTRVAVIGIMTLSGEIFTYLLNTLGSASRECLKFALQPGVPMANGGDDTARLGGVQTAHDWALWEQFDKCEDKRYISQRGEFVSFLISKGRVVKNPIILWLRLQGQIERGNLDNCYLGYFEHWARAYRLREELHDIYDEEMMEYHNLLTTFFMNGHKYSNVAHKANWQLVRECEDVGEVAEKGSLEWQYVNQQLIAEAFENGDSHRAANDSLDDALSRYYEPFE
ncbi:MAG: replicase [Brapardiv virus 1]|nr:MAG: replicase [Brapardiv virus 1]